MSRAFRHALALTVALALVASTGAWHPCMAMQLAAAAAGPSHHEQDAHHHAGHDHPALHHEHPSDAPGSPAGYDHDCLKCCAMCTVVAGPPPGMADATVFTVNAVVFFSGRQHWSGATIPIDPGIPKRIA